MEVAMCLRQQDLNDVSLLLQRGAFMVTNPVRWW